MSWEDSGQQGWWSSWPQWGRDLAEEAARLWHWPGQLQPWFGQNRGLEHPCSLRPKALRPPVRFLSATSQDPVEAAETVKPDGVRGALTAASKLSYKQQIFLCSFSCTFDRIEFLKSSNAAPKSYFRKLVCWWLLSSCEWQGYFSRVSHLMWLWWLSLNQNVGAEPGAPAAACTATA